MYDLLLKDAHVVDPLNGVNGVNDVAVEGGKIAAVGPDLTGPAREVIDVSGWVLQPGIIDSHVHLGSMWGSPYGPRMLAMNGVTRYGWSLGRYSRKDAAVRGGFEYGHFAVCVAALHL